MHWKNSVSLFILGLLLRLCRNSSYTILANIRNNRNPNYHSRLAAESSSGDDGYSNSNQATLNEIREKLRASEYREALQVLKRNPSIQLSFDDGKQFLNNIESLIPRELDDEKYEKQITEACTFIYKRMERLNLLRGFGCVEGEYPEATADMTPSRLEEVTGLSIAALTPRRRTNNWQLAGGVLCIVEYVIAANYGIDPVFSVIPMTLLILLSDQFFNNGAVFESVYQFLVPEYRQKVISHEAGHFLLAYLLGVPLRACVTNASDAKKYPEVKGQAGTLFYDGKLADEIANQRVTRSSLDRLSVVIMAGIAAEALKYSRAEGGVVDEQSLVQFLTSIQPPWNLLRIQNQARWAAVQALLLIREHQASYDALVEALEQKKSVGDAIEAIEKNLPSVLPSQQRIEARKKKQKNSEVDVLMRYIQRMTWRVGGIVESVHDDSDERMSLGPDGFLETSLETNFGSANISVGRADAAKVFTERIRLIENAVRSGSIDFQDTSSGGIWLNGLKSLEEGNGSLPGNESSSEPEGIKLPPAVEGYEDRIKSLQAEGLLKVNDDFVRPNNKEDSVSIEGKGILEATDDQSVQSLLTSHRGYQLKKLENIQGELKKKASSIDSRLLEINEQISSKQSVVVKR